MEDAMSTNKEDADKAYQKRQKKIASTIKRIQQALIKHADDDIHWGHVGDLGYVQEQLGIIEEFIQ